MCICLSKKGRLFVYINSQIPTDKQNFAAAHELYHIWFDKEYLINPQMLESKILNDETDNIRELRANLFAAMLLVPKHVLEQELLFLDIQKMLLPLIKLLNCLMFSKFHIKRWFGDFLK